MESSESGTIHSGSSLLVHVATGVAFAVVGSMILPLQGGKCGNRIQAASISLGGVGNDAGRQSARTVAAIVAPQFVRNRGFLPSAINFC